MEDVAVVRTGEKEGELLMSACCIADQLLSSVLLEGKKLLLRLDVLANRDL